MKPIILTFICFILTSGEAYSKIIPRYDEFGAGLDFNQLNTYFIGKKPRVNIGVVGYYSPYKFLKFNMGTYINNVGDIRGARMTGLDEYKSKGVCVKLGTELSLKVRQHSLRNKRLTWGYDMCLVSFRETGVIRIEEPYWGDYVQPFNTGRKNIKLWQFTLGYQADLKRLQFKMQLYVLFEDSYSDLKLVNKVVENYQPVFVPGFGYNQSGLNVCLYYRM